MKPKPQSQASTVTVQRIRSGEYPRFRILNLPDSLSKSEVLVLIQKLRLAVKDWQASSSKRIEGGSDRGQW
jgi:hypothetical protein